MGRKIKAEEKTENFNFTEEYIQKKLDGFFASSTQKYVMENLYVFGWESDKLIETRSGLIYEFEIKISKADFKNDFKNKKDKHAILEGTSEFLPYYEEVKKKYGEKYDYSKYYRTDSFKKPNYFYYAVPEGLIDENEIPSYAGLIYILPDDYKKKNGDYAWSGFYIVKQAPKLHSTKYTDDELKLGEKFYYNMLTWKNKCREMNDKLIMSENTEHEIPYIDLKLKYEKEKKENKSLRNVIDQNGQTIRAQQDNLMDDSKIIMAYREKIQQYEQNFNPFDFEYELLKDEDNEE